MKKIGFLMLMFVIAVTAGKAQPGQGGRGSGQPRQFNPEEMAKRQTQEIGEAVQFTQGQEAKVNDLNLKYAKKRQEMRSGGSFRDMDDAARQEMRKKMEALDTEKSKEMKQILTADQYVKYEKYLKDREQRMRDRGPRPQ